MVKSEAQNTSNEWITTVILTLWCYLSMYSGMSCLNARLLQKSKCDIFKKLRSCCFFTFTQKLTSVFVFQNSNLTFARGTWVNTAWTLLDLQYVELVQFTTVICIILMVQEVLCINIPAALYIFPYWYDIPWFAIPVMMFFIEGCFSKRSYWTRVPNGQVEIIPS